eukprot:9766143-Ditylum_brightwellii.AAC.1
MAAPHHAAPLPRVPLAFQPTNYAGPPRVVLRAPFPKLHFPSQPPHSTINHIYTTEGKKQSIDELLAGNDSKIWSTSTANELG